MRKHLVLAAKILVALAFAVIAIRMLVGEFRTLSAEEVGQSLASIGWAPVGLMLLATLSAYVAVATYDAFALRYAGKELQLRRSTVSSTSSYAISNMLGFPVFTGNAVRFWLFESWGLGAKETALAAIVTTIACNHALAIIAGVSFLLAPDFVTDRTALSTEWALAIGAGLLAASALLVGLGVWGPREIRIWRLHIDRPGPVYPLHLAICAVDYVATALVLYIPLSHAIGMDLVSFVVVFSIAKTIGIFSNVPGGLGVFEAVMASAVSSVPMADLAAALIAYRVVFYLVPFGIAASALARHALRLASRRIAPRQPSTPSA